MAKQNLTVEFMESVTDFLQCQYEDCESLQSKLTWLLHNFYDDDFDRFINDAVMNEDYGSAKPFLTKLYEEGRKVIS